MAKAQPLARATRASMPLRELVYWLFFAGGSVILLRYFAVGDMAQFRARLTGLNVFELGAAAVCIWRVLEFKSNRLAKGRDVGISLLMLVVLILAGIFPSLTGYAMFMFLLALYFINLQFPDRNLYAAAIVLLSLATHFLFAPFIFNLFIQTIVKMDVFLVGSVLHFVDPSIAVTGTSFASVQRPDQFSVILVGACSSFANISAAVLVHVAWAMAMRDHLTKMDAVAMGGTVIVATALNVTRIVLSTLSPDGFGFWHGYDGALPTGAIVFVLMQNLTLVIAGYLTAIWAGRAKP